MEFVGGVIVLLLDVYALWNVLTSSASTLAKVLWTLLILILPVLGFFIWLIAGPKGNRAQI